MGGRGVSEIFMHRLRLYFGVQNFDFQYLFIFFILFFFYGGGQKLIFLGYKDFVDIWGWASQTLASFRGIFYAF